MSTAHKLNYHKNKTACHFQYSLPFTRSYPSMMKISFVRQDSYYEISDFRRGVGEVLALLGKLQGVDWELFTDVSGERMCPIFQDRAVQEELLLTQETSSPRLIL